MRFILFAALVFSASCHKKVAEVSLPTGDVKAVAYDVVETLAPGQSLQVSKEAPLFTFVEVVSDSRCPQGVDCVRAGEAVARVSLPNGEIKDLVIEVDPKSPVRFGVKNGLVKVLGLDPYPVARVQTTPEAYRLRVMVEKAALE